MALLHGGASITPTKLEMLDAWVPTQDWYAGRPDPAFTLVGAFRLDDPAGVVGVETHLVRDGDGPVSTTDSPTRSSGPCSPARS